jgi:hypothetical protein
MNTNIEMRRLRQPYLTTPISASYGRKPSKPTQALLVCRFRLHSIPCREGSPCEAFRLIEANDIDAPFFVTTFLYQYTYMMPCYQTVIVLRILHAQLNPNRQAHSSAADTTT